MGFGVGNINALVRLSASPGLIMSSDSFVNSVLFYRLPGLTHIVFFKFFFELEKRLIVHVARDLLLVEWLMHWVVEMGH